MSSLFSIFIKISYKRGKISAGGLNLSCLSEDRVGKTVQENRTGRDLLKGTTVAQ